MPAIFVASPSLYEALSKPGATGKATLRGCAYIARMATRCTPFGLFAAIGAVSWGTETTLTRRDGTVRTRTRPDMAWLQRYLNDVAETVEERGHLQVAPAANLVVIGGRVYLVGVRGASTTSLPEGPPSMRWSPFVQKLIARAAQPCTTWDELAAWIAAEFLAPVDDAHRTIAQLLSIGFLKTRTESPLDADPISQARERLPDALEARHTTLKTLSCELTSYDAAGPNSTLDRLVPIVDRMNVLTKQAAVPVQVDAFVDFSGTLGVDILEAFGTLVDVLVRNARRLHMNALREQFIRRYEGSEALVPLLEFADVDLGLGAAVEIERDENKHAQTAYRSSALYAIIADALRMGTHVARLGKDELEVLLPPAPPAARLPTSIDVGCQLFIRRDPDRAASFIVAPSPYVCSDGAGRGSARFGSNLSNDALSAARTAATAALEDDALVAEVVYRPLNDRIANVAIRETWCDFRILDGYVEPSEPRTLPLSDLYVTMIDGRFAIVSRTYRRRVITHENHVVNPALAPQVSRVLALLALDGRYALESFDWGECANAPFLPRLECGKTVVSAARWRVAPDRFDGENAAARIAEWRARWNVPRWIVIKSHDNRLPVDLDSPLGRVMMVDQSRGLKPGAMLEIEELHPGPDDCWVSDGRDTFSAEFVVSASRVERARETVPGPLFFPTEGSRVTSDSRWLYFRLFGPRSGQDVLLRDHVAPLIAELIQRDRIIEWFFVRYEAPRSHIRLRVRATGATSEITAGLVERFSAFSRDRTIDDFELAQFKPETERYCGDENWRRACAVFSESSDAALRAIAGAPLADREAQAVVTFQGQVAEALPAETRAAWLSAARAAGRTFSKSDRTLLKALQTVLGAEPQIPAGAVVRDLFASAPPERLEALVRDLFHMHCNRFGLFGIRETIAYTTIVAANYGFQARLVAATRAPVPVS